jgi:hypothetical protein
MEFVPLWTSILRSRKISRLPGDLFKFWISCLLLAKEHDPRDGCLPSIDDLSYALHISEKDCLASLSSLVKLSLIEVHGQASEMSPDIGTGGGYPSLLIANWRSWKVGKDPTGAIKKQRYRERQKELRNSQNGQPGYDVPGRPPCPLLSPEQGGRHPLKGVSPPVHFGGFDPDSAGAASKSTPPSPGHPDPSSPDPLPNRLTQEEYIAAIQAAAQRRKESSNNGRP